MKRYRFEYSADDEAFRVIRHRDGMSTPWMRNEEAYEGREKGQLSAEMIFKLWLDSQ